MSKLRCPKCGYKLQDDGNFVLLRAETYKVIPDGDKDFNVKSQVMEEDYWIRCNNCETIFDKFASKK